MRTIGHIGAMALHCHRIIFKSLNDMHKNAQRVQVKDPAKVHGLMQRGGANGDMLLTQGKEK
ncbi:hypothetical protein N7517_003972 [Penicillium concentricum]|uniref:Uncharacterized protein n=1 Tax=Penicillium concentricum TaxID=293559 RepID=A0A9W9VA87_9EURO|nr:uncharacterized protein N7517_003972 [Penicillium concentricum]KAJ5371966.1 hypothetical protein N7517_003972 [Penicillium concentricum]